LRNNQKTNKWPGSICFFITIFFFYASSAQNEDKKFYLFLLSADIHSNRCILDEAVWDKIEEVKNHSTIFPADTILA